MRQHRYSGCMRNIRGRGLVVLGVHGVRAGRLVAPARARRLVEGLLSGQEAREHAIRGAGVLSEGARAAAALALQAGQGRPELGAHVEVRVQHVLAASVMAEEEVPERQAVELFELHALRAAEREAIIIEGAGRVRLLRQPYPLPPVGVEQILQVLEHRETRKGQDLHGGEEVQRDHRRQVRREVTHGQSGPDGRQRPSSLTRPSQPEEPCIRASDAPRGVEEEKGVDRAPPGDEVDVLQVGDAVVEREARRREEPPPEGRGQEQRQRRQGLGEDRKEGHWRQQCPRAPQREDLHLVGEWRGHAEGKMRALPAQEQSLEDGGLQRRPVPPRAATFQRGRDFRHARAAVCGSDDELHHPGGEARNARLQLMRLGSAPRALRPHGRGAEGEEDQGRGNEDCHVRADMRLAIELAKVQVVQNQRGAEKKRLGHCCGPEHGGGQRRHDQQ
mmetsp:Transcript_56529/g.172120  ORF Transcript_56529/g.172120 Transcript_56529/m.172120 type:complete len:446 (+) Transcript_56529:876-2213(+)